MRIATFNVNGINGRLPRLLEWLEETAPDVVALQELKAPNEKFPAAAIERAGYGAVWHGQSRWNGVALQELKAPNEKFPAAAIERAGYGAVWHGQSRWNGVALLARGCEPIETHRGLPGDPEDVQSRYLEGAVNGVLVAALYVPNGNPRPGPKFDYKLRWLERFAERAALLLESGAPVVMAGDFNIIPTELDVYKPERWTEDALFHSSVREAFARLTAAGWTDALRSVHPDERIFTFWDYFRNAYARDAGLRIDHLLLSPAIAPRLTAAGVDRYARGREGASDHAPTWIELAYG